MGTTKQVYVLISMMALVLLVGSAVALTGSYVTSAGIVQVEGQTPGYQLPPVASKACGVCQVQPFYVGAGRNDPAKGTYVGSIMACNDGLHFWIVLTMNTNYTWQEVHMSAAARNGEVGHVFGHYPFVASCSLGARGCGTAYVVIPLATFPLIIGDNGQNGGAGVITSITSLVPGNLAYYAVHIATAPASAVQGTGLMVAVSNRCFNFNEVFKTGRWGAYCAMAIRSCSKTPGTDPCVDPYTPPCQNYRTVTQGGWGTMAHGHNPGWYRDTYWSLLALPIRIGCTSSGTYFDFFDSPEVVTFLRLTKGTPALLDSSLGVSTPNSILAAQLLAASLNVAFDNVDLDNFGTCPGPLANLCFASTGTLPCAGQTVANLLSAANHAVGGCPVPSTNPVSALGLSLTDYNTCLTAINENFDGATPVGDLVACLTTA